MFLRLLFRRMTFGQWMVAVGGTLLAVGLLLLLVKLAVLLSYFAEIVTLAGGVVLVIGLWLGGRRKGRADEGNDGIPYY